MDKSTKELMISMVEEIPNFTAVRKLLGITIAELRYAREKDSKFNEELETAKESGYDMMEDEAHRRAVKGWVEPVFYQGEQVVGPDGKPVGVRRYSDHLMKFLLTHCKPKKFNPGVKVNVGDGEKVSFIFNMGKE